MEREPRAEAVTHPDWMVRVPGAIPWDDVRTVLADCRNYWVTTVRPDGQPHARPVWGVWWDGALGLSAGGGYWMLRNIHARPKVTVHPEAAEGLVVVVDGTARSVEDVERRQQIVDVYNPKYDFNYGVDWDGTIEVVPDRVYAWITKAGSDDYRATRFSWT
jgi:uncharacterized pyridoxamine 5'-phosphate oxidase family protein